ncbi:high mobility group B protein 6 [Cryptomeria japonica]|uniref:high mobility group B protein 6 n=1 Tax=Cryptomeria japonica TaxID=3369 RepID=UPI0027DA6FE8|nr:high mobility group B protein 6 [Cryptomeria japonica]
MELINPVSLKNVIVLFEIGVAVTDASAEKMNTECEQNTPKKWRRTSGWKNDTDMVKPKNEQREETSDKENRGVATNKQRQRKKETLKNVSNLLPPPPSSSSNSKKSGHIRNHKRAGIGRSPQPHLEEQSHEKILGSSPTCPIKSNSSLKKELQPVRLRLQKLNIDKERTDKLLDERDALLKQKEAELEIKAKAQERLQLQLIQFQKLKEFKSALNYPLEQSLRMVELAKEKEKEEKINDPNRLKEPSLPYILWCQDQWNQMKSENQNIPFKDMGTIMGENWKVLNAEEKKRYNDKYEAEKEAYLQAAVQQKQQQNEGGTDPNRPKKPPTSFLLSSNKTREMLAKERPEVSNTANNALISAKWKELEEACKKNGMIREQKTEEQTQHQFQFIEEEMEVGMSTANTTCS